MSIPCSLHAHCTRIVLFSTRKHIIEFTEQRQRVATHKICVFPSLYFRLLRLHCRMQFKQQKGNDNAAACIFADCRANTTDNNKQKANKTHDYCAFYSKFIQIVRVYCFFFFFFFSFSCTQRIQSNRNKLNFINYEANCAFSLTCKMHSLSFIVQSENYNFQQNEKGTKNPTGSQLFYKWVVGLFARCQTSLATQTLFRAYIAHTSPHWMNLNFLCRFDGVALCSAGRCWSIPMNRHKRK